MAKTRKILMIVENVPAPKDRRVWPEAITLRDYGFQVSIISPKGVSECRESYASVDGIHLYRYKFHAIGHKYIGYAAEYGTPYRILCNGSCQKSLEAGLDWF